MQNFKCPTMLYLFILVKKQIPTKNIHKISRIIFTITVEIPTCMLNDQELFTSTVEPQLFGPQLSGLFDYPDFLLWSQFFHEY